MRATIFFYTLGAAAVGVLCEELRAADVPAACSTICKPIVDLSGTCDIDPNEADMADNDNMRRRELGLRADQDGGNDGSDEAIEANCICTNKSFDVAGIMALCASCIAQNGKAAGGGWWPMTGPSHSHVVRIGLSSMLMSRRADADNMMSQCAFESTSYVPSATSLVSGIHVQATKPTATAAGALESSPTSSAPSPTRTGNGGARAVAGSVAVLASAAFAALLAV